MQPKYPPHIHARKKKFFVVRWPWSFCSMARPLVPPNKKLTSACHRCAAPPCLYFILTHLKRAGRELHTQCDRQRPYASCIEAGLIGGACIEVGNITIINACAQWCRNRCSGGRTPQVFSFSTADFILFAFLRLGYQEEAHL